MLLVFVRERGDSFRNVDRREVAAMKSNHVFHPTPPKFNRYRISFQNHQDGLNTKHTTSQALSAGCGGNMSTRNTMLPVINRGGPGSYRRRERRGVIPQKETQFYSKAQQIPRSLNQHFQNNRVRSKTTHKTRQALPACCGGNFFLVAGAIRC